MNKKGTQRQPSEIERDRRNIGRLYLRGIIQADIAEKLNLSQPTVSRDLKVIQKQWKIDRVDDINERKNIELDRVDELEREYWAAWIESKQDEKTKKIVKVGEKNARQELTSKEQVGNPAFLRGVEWCINKRCDLLGLDAPKRTDITSGEKKDDTPILPSIPAELIAPDFLGMYRNIMGGHSSEYLVKGGRGSTKSSFVSLAIVYLIVNNPTFNALLLRNITNTLRDSVFSQIKWAISMLGLWDYFKPTVSPMGIEYLPTGQMIYFRGADKPEKLKGIIPKVGYIAILWLEELDQFRGQEAVRNIRQTAIRGGEDAYTFLTYNPPKSTGNWVNKYSLIPKDGRYVHSSDYRNVPTDWLGQPFIDEAEHLEKVNPKAYRHEYLGEITGTGGMVFDNVTTREITDKEAELFDRPLHGLDWGFFPDPLSYGKMHYDAARLKLYIFEEHRSNRESNSDSYESIKKKGYNDAGLLIADSAEPKSIADYRSYGANVRGSEKGAGSVKYSMKWLQSLSEIIIDPARAPHHAIEFTGYEFEQDKNGDFITAYPDKNNHAIDDVRYATNLIWRRRGA